MKTVFGGAAYTKMQLFIRSSKYQTEPRPLAESRIFWGQLEWEFCVLAGDAIPLHLWWWQSTHFLAPWVCVDVCVPVAERKAKVSLPYGELHIQYHAQRKYDAARQKVVVAVRILEVELCFSFGPEALWNAFVVMEHHQLVARIRVGPPTQSPLAQHYLGRAQLVQTHEFARRRTYKWLPRPDEETRDTGNLSPRNEGEWEGHAREARELQRISGRGSSSIVYVTPRAQLSSPAPNNKEGDVTDMDNEAWSNGRRILPVRLQAQDGGIKVQIFNLGAASEDCDVPYAESCYLRWESFMEGLFLQTELTRNLKLKVYYHRSDDDNDSIQITQLVLVARNYSQILRHMGQNQGAKTV